MNKSALFNIGYGLYVLTTKRNGKDNGCIVNTVMQITNTAPLYAVVAINKQNYTHDVIMETKEFNVSVLTTETPFDVFKHYGFRSGKDTDKFAGYDDVDRSKNGIVYLTKYANAYLSFKVVDTDDYGSHTLFKAEITDSEVISSSESVTYSYYQKYIKPKPQSEQESGYRCIICGYIHEGDHPPDECPLCGVGPEEFEEVVED